MKQIKIFLASSEILKEFRKELIIKISEKNKIWNEKSLNLELVIWEDLSEKMQLTRSQDAYNREISKCDMFVLLASDTLGKYSREEFEVAYDLFQTDGKPKVLVYLKEGTKEDESLQSFKEYLQSTEYFPAYYNDFATFWDKLYKEIEQHLHPIWKNMDIRKKNDTFSKKIGEMPLYPKVFKGREGKLAEIYKAFFEDKKLVILLNGEGGLGKTTTASRYYHKYEDYYSHLIWAVNQNKIDNTLLSLAPYLKLKFDDKMSKEEQIRELLNTIDSLQDPVLLVIDNVDDYDDLMQNHHYLGKTPNIHILITTRITTFEEFDKIKIEKLSPQKAKELFLYYYKHYDSKEEEILLFILEAIGYNTLSIELLAKNLNSTKIIGYNLEKLLTDLQEEGLLKLSTSTKVAHTYHNLESAKPENIVKAMYSIAPLTEEELKLLSVFSLLPEMVLTFENVKEISPIKEEDLEDIILDLTNKAWLEMDEENTGFKINTIVATIIREEKQNSLYKNAKKLINKTIEVLDYDTNTGMVQDYNKALLYANYAESFLKYLKEIEYDLSLVAGRVGSFHRYYGQLSKALEYYEKYKKLKEELYNLAPDNVSFKNGLAISYERLGNVYKGLGDMERALEYYEKEKKLFEELYNLAPDNVSFKNGLAISYGKLGGVHESLGDMERALEYYEKDLKVTEELYNLAPDNVSFKYNLAYSYFTLGKLFFSQDRYKEALEYFDKGVELQEELYFNNPKHYNIKSMLGVLYQLIGYCQQKLDDDKEALKSFKKYYKIKSELFDMSPELPSAKSGLAYSCERLGELYHKLKDFKKAQKYLDKEVELFSELTKQFPENREYFGGLSSAYGELSRLYLSMKDCEKSQKYADLSQEILENLVQKYSDIKEYQKLLTELSEHMEKMKKECK